MRYTLLSLVVLSLVAGSPTSAQTPARTPEQLKSNYDAHAGDFDYLLGDWQFTATSKEWGKGQGYWSAVRLAEGQILDEYRLVGDKGETFYVTTTLRAYNATLDRWELVGMDRGNGLQDVGTATKTGGEVRIEQKFGVMTSNPVVRRIRYYNIAPGRFSWASDLSKDGGRTWEKDNLQIEARRIGAARSLESLAPARNKSDVR